jgi:hypothetical protein
MVFSLANGQNYTGTRGSKLDKYFIGAGYSFGTAWWSSTMMNSTLYDRKGNILLEGDMKFKAKNSTSSYGIEVLAPVKSVMLGVGISFEEFYLEKVSIQPDYNKEAKQILFDESFRFDKIFGQIEVPFNVPLKDMTLAYNGRFGYYGCSGIQRINFFGVNPLGQTFFAGSGIRADWMVYDQCYIFAMPNVEFKYFNNSKTESPSDIVHKIFSTAIYVGIRYDLRKTQP